MATNACHWEPYVRTEHNSYRWQRQWGLSRRRSLWNAYVYGPWYRFCRRVAKWWWILFIAPPHTTRYRIGHKVSAMVERNRRVSEAQFDRADLPLCDQPSTIYAWDAVNGTYVKEHRGPSPCRH